MKKGTSIGMSSGLQMHAQGRKSPLGSPAQDDHPKRKQAFAERVFSQIRRDKGRAQYRFLTANPVWRAASNAACALDVAAFSAIKTSLSVGNSWSASVAALLPSRKQTFFPSV